MVYELPIRVVDGGVGVDDCDIDRVGRGTTPEVVHEHPEGTVFCSEITSPD